MYELLKIAAKEDINQPKKTKQTSFLEMYL